MLSAASAQVLLPDVVPPPTIRPAVGIASPLRQTDRVTLETVSPVFWIRYAVVPLVNETLSSTTLSGTCPTITDGHTMYRSPFTLPTGISRVCARAFSSATASDAVSAPLGRRRVRHCDAVA